MISPHVLDDLGAGQRGAVLARLGGLHVLVHEATADAGRIKAAAVQGSEVLATHLWDKEAILALVAGRVGDVGGEG